MKRDSANRRAGRKNKSPETRTALPETDRGSQVSVDRDELLGLMQESLAALAVELGLRVASAILEDEVTRLCGARYQRQPGRSHTRYGHQKGTVRLGGQKLPIDRPRVRRVGGGGEVPLETYTQLQSPDDFPQAVLRRMVRGVSTREYKNVVDMAQHGFGVAKSSVSRGFVRASAADVKKLAERRFDSERFPVVMIDGVDYPYAYCSPCHERYRSASPAPMPGQRTEVTNLRATGVQPLFMSPPFVRWRVAA